jgi:site-specific recombinase XerD
VRAQLADRYSAASCAKALAALRGVLRECFRLGLMTAEDHARAVDLDAVRGSRVLRGRALSGAELRALFRSCSATTNQGCRDAALLAVAYGCGLRRSELVHLNIEHYDPLTGALVVAGKGNKERVVHVANGAGAALATWLARRGTEPGPVFLPVDKRGVIQHRRLIPDAVLVIVRRLAAKSGVARFSPHDLRRSMASDSLDAGVDVVVLQKILGHADVSTSAKYCRRGLRAQRHAAELLQIPVVAA